MAYSEAHSVAIQIPSMGRKMLTLSTIYLAVSIFTCGVVNGDIPPEMQKKINSVNSKGPCLGVVIPNAFEMIPLLQSPSYTPDMRQPYIDFAGKRFRFGAIGGKKVILVMTGLGMINAATTTQLLLGLFRIEGVVHYGIAGNANPSLIIGDVAIPRYWAHSALWTWQRFGDGPKNELPFESDGDFTRKIGYLRFADYATDGENIIRDKDNLLNGVWYQPEEIFPADGTPEKRQQTFWVPVDPHYFNIASKLSGLKLEACVNATFCLPRSPKVLRVARGMSAGIFLDNAAYRDFLFTKFKLTPVDMESASVALVSYQQRVPFIVIRSLSDLAGGGSSESNEAATFTSLAAANSITAVIEFIKLL